MNQTKSRWNSSDKKLPAINRKKYNTLLSASKALIQGEFGAWLSEQEIRLAAAKEWDEFVNAVKDCK